MPDFLVSVLSILQVAVIFLVMISILVAAHEYGHYLFARIFKMGVEEFAIGFGKQLKILGRKSYEVDLPADQAGLLVEHAGGQRPDGSLYLRETTDFSIRLWPLGGFVRIKGMIPQDDGSETKIPGGFYSKPPWQRWLVLFAGPLFSVIAGILVLVPVYTIWGIEKPVNRPVLGGIVRDSGADKAGLKAGDRVVSIDGETIETFGEMTQIVYASKGQPLQFVIDRNGQNITTEVTPKVAVGPTMDRNLDPIPGERERAVIGVTFQIEKKPQAFGPALQEASLVPVKAVVGIARLFIAPKHFEESVGGPGTIVSAVNAATKRGVEYVLWLSAMLSISVGIMNLLPVPPLDGGQMIMAFAEMLRGGKRLSIRVQSAVTTAGMALVFLLIAAVLFVDVKRFTPKPAEPAASPPIELKR